MIKAFFKRRFPRATSFIKKMIFFRNRIKSEERVFTDYYIKNFWKNNSSRSGPGSDLVQTEKLIRDLPGILKEYDCKTMLDAPCGDFFWMHHVDLTGIQYTGADIVKELIQRNQEVYGNDSRVFIHRNLQTDLLESFDLIFCRDLMVHLSNDSIIKLIRNFKRSGSRYLLTTNFNGDFKNIDIVAGDWRVLNLMSPPFNFPGPTFKYKEDSTLGDGKYPDKYLCLWKLNDIDV